MRSTTIALNQKFQKNIFHDIDHQLCYNRLNSFYGRVAEEQNKAICSLVKGTKVLDIGAGYGTLTKMLKNSGRDSVGIEPHEEKRQYAKTWYNIELLDEDIYKTSFSDHSFDCVILREVVFHLNFELAIKEINRITRNQIIIFQGNSIILRKIGQLLFHHREYNEKDRYYYTDLLEQNDFTLEHLIFRDPLAFPLSGGFIGVPLIPNLKVLYEAAIKCDFALNKLLNLLHLQQYFCSRFLLSAVKSK
jgi:SAM-dependent methyltransferase